MQLRRSTHSILAQSGEIISAMPSRTLALPFRWIVLLALSLSTSAAHAQRVVRQIEIHSAWGGLGNPGKADIVIRQERGFFLRDGKRVDAALVNALLAALDEPLIPKPD